MMRIDLALHQARGNPVCVGAGFVALDIVESSVHPFAAAGGSCGNVMAILAWLGWDAKPVARIGADWAGELLTTDMDRTGADTSSFFVEERVKTPIVIERFVEHASGQRSHRFSLTCPECGAWLPRYRALTVSQINEFLIEAPQPKAFYFDRVSPATVKLARWAKDEGAIVIFEPSAIGDERLFQKAVELCHILKFSHDRLGHIHDLAKAPAPRMVVETRGEEGLRVRWRSRWSDHPAFQVSNLRDAAGSGDWCSAGLIHMLAQKNGAKAFEELRKADLDRAIRFGQALAAVNCSFEGARGAMLALSLKQVGRLLVRLKETGNKSTANIPDSIPGGLEVPTDLCGICSTELDGDNQKVRIKA